jgi:heptosyltransferase-1
LVAHAALIIGVDTGLTHLSAVLGKPTVEIYCDYPKWKTEGYWGKAIANVGDYKKSPLAEEVELAVIACLGNTYPKKTAIYRNR